jgi:hypothetical protein
MDTMNRTFASLTTAAAVATAALAPGAMAADAPAPKLELKGAYLYVDHIKASHQDFVRVVFRTAKPLPRRYDGLIRAGASIEGVGHSIGTAKRATTCYTALSEIKGGRIAVHSADGKVAHRVAKVGRTYTFTLTTTDGQSVTRKLHLSRGFKGYATGRPLGC